MEDLQIGNRWQEGDRGLSFLPRSCIIWQEACLLTWSLTVCHDRHWVMPLASVSTGSYKK